jgi:hypothetical protein
LDTWPRNRSSGPGCRGDCDSHERQTRHKLNRATLGRVGITVYSFCPSRHHALDHWPCSLKPYRATKCFGVVNKGGLDVSIATTGETTTVGPSWCLDRLVTIHDSSTVEQNCAPAGAGRVEVPPSKKGRFSCGKSPRRHG